MEKGLEEYSGKRPDVVSLSYLDESHIPETANPSTQLNYQLCFTKGYGGDPNKLKVSVPGANYTKFFTVSN